MQLRRGLALALINMTLIRRVRSSSRLPQQSWVLPHINKYAACQFVFGQFAGERISMGRNLAEGKLIC